MQTAVSLAILSTSDVSINGHVDSIARSSKAMDFFGREQKTSIREHMFAPSFLSSATVVGRCIIPYNFRVQVGRHDQCVTMTLLFSLGWVLYSASRYAKNSKYINFWYDDSFLTTFGLTCREQLDVSKIHIHVGHDVLQRDFVEDWLDYVVAVSRVVRTPGVFVLSSTFPAKEKIRCGEGGYRSC